MLLIKYVQLDNTWKAIGFQTISERRLWCLGKELVVGFMTICFHLRLTFGFNIPGCGVKLGWLVEGQKLLSEHDPAGL